MEPHVERMFKEQTELCEKIEKLGEFISKNPIFDTLSKDEQYDMKLQLGAMELYSSVLQHRLDRATS
jgi:hypothetical protein